MKEEAGAFRAEYSYDDRGRGDHIIATWKFDAGDVTFISIGGERPKGIVDLPQQAISGGGPRPAEPSDASLIELKGNHGSWRIQPDVSGKSLDLSFKTI